MILWKILSIFILFLFLVRCSVHDDKTELKIKGKVSNIMNKPIISANVSLSKMEFRSGITLVETFTDSNGKYDLHFSKQRCSELDLVLIVKADGYLTEICSEILPRDKEPKFIKCVETEQIFNFTLNYE